MKLKMPRKLSVTYGFRLPQTYTCIAQRHVTSLQSCTSLHVSGTGGALQSEVVSVESHHHKREGRPKESDVHEWSSQREQCCSWKKESKDSVLC